MKTYLNDDWQFFREWTEDIFTRDGGEAVRLPHTNVETPFNCFDESIYQFVSGYRTYFHLKKVVGTYLLTFEGVAQACTVFVNGAEVASHHCGYTAFTLDISNFVVPGNNQIVVKVDSRESLNQPPFGNVIDYLTYGGIYREVYLEHICGTYVADVFVVAQPQKPLEAHVTLGNFESCTVHIEVMDGDLVESFSVDAEKPQFVWRQPLDLRLWDIDNPNVYTLKLTVCGNTYQTNFGVRSVEFTKEGVFLNGKKVKIVGLNRHQSFPYVGYAMPESMQRRDAQILKKQLCVNAVRTSHYPQSHYFLDECDKLGLLVFTEIPGWQHLGDNAWKALALKNVEEMILQYRNHPSIMIWGVRINESADCDWLYEKTNELAHSLDGTRPTGGVRNFTHSHLLEDVYTFNDFNRNGATNRNNVCEKTAPYLVTEYNGHMFPTKSYDDFPHIRQHVLRYARMLDGVFASPTTCGAFGWCMFDYNTHKDFGSGDRICYHGVMDMFRNAKIAAGIFSAMGSEPFLELCFTPDIGDYPEGGVGEMYCLTNAERVEVFKGDVFIKAYTHKDSPFKNMPNPPILIDDLIGNRLTDEDGIAPKYAQMIKEVLAEIWNTSVLGGIGAKTKLKILRIMKGTKLTVEQLVELHNKYRNSWGTGASALTIKAYNGNQLVAQRTIGSAANVTIQLKPSALVLHENTTYDVAAVNIVAVDQNGNRARYLSKAVQLRTEGVIELIGESNIALMGGMSGTFVKTIGKKGKGKLFVDDQCVEFEVV